MLKVEVIQPLNSHTLLMGLFLRVYSRFQSKRVVSAQIHQVARFRWSRDRE